MAAGRDNETRYVKIPIRGDVSHLSTGNKDTLEALISAARLINPIYLAQMNQKLEETGGIIDESRNAAYYPPGMTAEELEVYIQAHPDQKQDILSPFSVVQRDGTLLKTIPYAELYEPHLTRMKLFLEHASRITDHPQFKKFLKSKAAAFVSNEYKESDIDWIHVTDAPIELTIGPYESYEDKTLGIKRNFEAMLGVTLTEENEKVRQYQDLTLEFDAYLGNMYGYTPSGKITPMVVMNEILATGGAYYSYIAMAYNLPNDNDIHETVGSKKVFVKNVMDAKFTTMTIPIAERIVERSMMHHFDPWTYFLFVVGHELSHGLGFRFSGPEFKELGPSLEEAKADVFGMLFLYFLAEKGVLAKEVAESAVYIHAIDGLRQLRFGLEEAHAFGARIQYQWLENMGAIGIHEQTFLFDPRFFKQALESLGYEFFKLSQAQNYTNTKSFADTWSAVLPGLKPMIKRLEGIPVDIDPIFDC
ncbi:MAG: hypothetical protein COU47_04005 [Candidatus Niyogibacteria bacterium CG10_big_fil_rev_8_21_14_0_10_46_36]|uniref:Peptidase n=1 Tax=Candidatus Niyogibacteria bacterium CG10_big_fil_rev_8_21_14_0_10_46_36 TaxID=1974726 RepID=A0A2H0TEI6_9BACT|nr:MAG: hypothetical protein COU47_04005 [Candidatus Niyogibacteria bacterium CG10_big_fil_rev_8_21_14_0_10_46_36]